MSLVVAFDDTGPQQINRNKGGGGAPASTNYRFFMASKSDFEMVEIRRDRAV